MKLDYFAAGVVGVVAGACWAGAVLEPELVLIFLIMSLLSEGLLISNEETRQSTTITLASIQVPFSNTSVVCFTPMNWLLKPAILPARPPPLGFCIKTRNNSAISVLFDLLNSECKISAFTGIEQT